MNLFVDCLLYVIKLLYYIIEGIVIACLPAFLCKQKDVAGDTVLITGAGSGLGRLLSLRFAELKCTVVLWDVNAEGNEETAKQVRQLGGKAYCYKVDLSQREDIYKAAAQVKEEIGEVDILVNNAGIVTGKKLLDCPDGLIEKTMAVNVNAHFWTIKAFLPAMLNKNNGHIVTVASSAGLFGVTGLADYCASKHAAVGLDESLREELVHLGKTGVQTTVVCPYYINTGMFQGVQTKFPLVLPIVEPEYAVKKIMEAVLTNQQMLCFPFSVYILYALKGLLPTKASELSSAFFGANHGMNDFVGRSKTA